MSGPIGPIPTAERSSVGYEAYGTTIPKRMAIKIDEYIQTGAEVGHFLTAVICNDLTEALFHADPENLQNLRAYACYFYNEAPSPCWGSPEKMAAWQALFTTTQEDPA